MTDSGRPRLTIPPHLGVILGLSTGGYVLALATVTSLQAATEASARLERAPTVAALERLAAGHDRLTSRLDSARAAYESAAGSYAGAGIQVAELDARLQALADAVAEVSGTAASLPSGVRLPPISRTVVTVSPPAVQATTGASGG